MKKQKLSKLEIEIGKSPKDLGELCRSIHKKGMIPEVIQDEPLGLQYGSREGFDLIYKEDGSLGEVWASWSDTGQLRGTIAFTKEDEGFKIIHGEYEGDEGMYSGKTDEELVAMRSIPHYEVFLKYFDDLSKRIISDEELAKDLSKMKFQDERRSD